MNFLTKKWNWKEGAVALAIAFFLAILLVKPIGVSTQFVIFDGAIWNAVDSGLISETLSDSGKTEVNSTNPYLDKSNGKYAKNILDLMNYGFIFVLSMIFGGFLGKRVSKDKYQPESKSFIKSFVGGFLILFGARLAGGCTSGHMMSGMMQTSVSGYLFALSVFVVAIPTAIIITKLGRK